MKRIHLSNLTPAQDFVVQELKGQLGILLVQDGVRVELVAGKGLSLSREQSGWKLRCEKRHYFARALGLLVENFDQPVGFTYAETPAYESLGVMIDCSRNAVLTVDAFCRTVRLLSMMGYSTIQLYTEDTYEVEGYEYFGYLRGAYTPEELQACDAYADQFGVELVPCVQTLAHVEYLLKWHQFSEVHDCADILLAGEEKTYQLIDAMFQTMSTSIKSRKINIGMDEAPMLGRGKYLDKHGYEKPSKIMVEHLNRVVEIARKYGYQPMMWSDTFFRLVNDGEYDVRNQEISPEVIGQIPQEVSLVYWDYYGEDLNRYVSMMKSHLKFERKILFAGGAWKWHGFTPGNEFGIHVAKIAQQACQIAGIRDVLITAWGDNGAEGSFFSILPTLHHWAEACYSGQLENEALNRRFFTVTGASLDDWMKLDTPLLTPDNPSPGAVFLNPPKYFLYQDILCGLLDYHIHEDQYTAHFRNAAALLEECGQRNPAWKHLFETQASLCRILERKTDVGVKITKAYRADDRAALKALATVELPDILKRIEAFQEVFSHQWLWENKVFGLDCFDLRIGGLKERVRRAISRLQQFADGAVPTLPELEVPRLPMKVSRFNGSPHYAFNKWVEIATPSCMVGL